MPKIFQTTIIKRGDVIIVPPVSNGELTEERLTYDNLNKAQKAINTHSAVVAVMDAQKRAIESVTAAFAAELTEPNKDAVESPFVEAMVSDMAQRAFDQTVIAASVAEMGKRADDAIQFIAIPTSDQAKRAVEDINSEVRASALELAKKAIDDIQASILARTEMNQKATDEIVIDLVRLEVNQKAVEDVSNTVTATAAEPNQKADDSIEAAIISLPDDTKKAEDVGTVIANYTGYANQNVSTTGWVNPANALGDTTGTASTLTAASSGLAGTTSNTTTGTITLGLENPSPLISDLNITGPVAIEVERQIVGAGTLPLGQSHNIVYEYQISGATGNTFNTPPEPFTYSNGSNMTWGSLKMTGPSTFVVATTNGGAAVNNINTTTELRFITYPAGIQNGDTVILHRIARATEVVEPPAGYNLISSLEDFRSDFVIQTYVYTANGTESGSQIQVFNVSSPKRGAAMAVYRGVTGVSIGNAHIYTGGTGTTRTHALVSSVTQDRVVYLNGRAQFSTEAPTVYTDAIKRADVYSSVNNVDQTSSVIADEVMVTAPAGWLPIGSDVGTTGSVAKGFVSVSTSLSVLSDIDNLQVRAVGTVVSGTGLGASKAASVFRARVRLTAEKDY